MRPRALRRLVVSGLVAALGAGLSACSSGIAQSDYAAPIAVDAAPAPAPVVPVAAPATARPGRLPLLPPVPEEQGGLPPVTVAQLLPPPVK
jgi:hypothetical protein